MSTEDVSRIFMPQRKTVQRSNSSSSLSSNASSSSTSSSATTTDASSASSAATGEANTVAAKKKTRGGFWPVSKAESTSGVSAARANGSVQPASLISGKAPIQPALPTQNGNQQNGARVVNGAVSQDTSALLALLPMNGTFERKQINVPFFPDILRVGRQTNAKTVPTPTNGFFDSKVLSRQHAEVWAERNGKVWIRDVKSSNGTFVNGQRLSQENRESEPHELRQHDTLELGIDIVSEDQKTIVHHKVSAKVEYVGLPGTTNNVLELSFGDLDPSHGGSLLPPISSSPMMQSRSRPGGVAGPVRSAPSSIAGGQMSAAAQNRQINLWGPPLSVEHLVKQISHEMRAAKHQATDLDNIEKVFDSIISPGSKPSPAKDEPQSKEESQPRQANAKPRSIRTDNLARFADPPAPPPQLPLPEKPDSAKSTSLNSMSLSSLLKRTETAKPGSNGTSPTSGSQSSMLQLVEALSQARKELESHSIRVKELEEMLKDERSARADAEERARRLEQSTANRPITNVEEISSSDEKPVVAEPPPESTKEVETSTAEDDRDLQTRLDHMVAEMQKMKTDMDKFKTRAESAEVDATKARESLAEMIQRLRQENSEEDAVAVDKTTSKSSSTKDSDPTEDAVEAGTKGGSANGHVRTPKLPAHLEQAVATALRQGSSNNSEALAQSAPYVSMLGVVLIGVGLMAYLNSWQKTDK
ncbi:uncharacterized protein HMPREF1541_01074 [Cyphellophora europaea CBS 101466]|uniref:FHA domain-containing protein n=1 Tax=Cyphellophora europaea (strain CBS 101466) TaxID=1220924 RepID=W2SE53_CYPE1|nr:uncharacterized protein HMPREF1541_01074 [Cyphellophora europaea CBS 101466]ETN46885.1 hypothetical protein HMPREF1541_01074 [Cyphellophora europaea CBS 101466]